MAYVYMWAFDVVADNASEFERHYGPEGTWARLFLRAPGYIGTLLLMDPSTSGRYVTIDRWRDEAAFDAFRTTFATEYEQLDRECEHLTLREQALGVFDEVDGAIAVIPRGRVD
ncbi:antibiotic biosynthesis monooxygenase family protein [Cognatilysobacter terrigena]|uniref:antibiotic biosynthesis monooxygenase family protein n=1 Tax=Cognatilysobacter terrigena TaxID=2488749 RepID=UPI001061D528|nr:antibiotic biosynthesis monooxygenase family protein [Lysobacter terrigena]